MDHADRFNQYHPLLFSIAYRMLGSVMDAEDMVQETYLRWQRADADTVDSDKSYLTTTITRLCIDHLRSARIRREQYVGPWLPEPLPTNSASDAADIVALDESITLAFLLLLETLEPVERAVYLLREVFDYSYAEIAGIVGKSEANCRQMIHRSRGKIANRRRRFDASPAQGERLTHAFVQACAAGDLTALLKILADDVTVWSDGGPHVQAARRPIHGADRVARFFLGLMRWAPTGLTPQFTWINGQPGLVNTVDGQPHSVIVLEIDGDRIASIRTIVNPDKLRHLKPAV